MRALRSVVQCDIPSMILLFEVGVRPTAIHQTGVSEKEIREVEQYLAGPYLLDPYYHAALAGAPPGVYRLRDIAPAGFRQSEFYRTYWRHTGIRDEIEMFVRLPDTRFAMVSLLRKQLPPFRSGHVRFLEAVHPLVAAFIVRHWSSRTRPAVGTSVHVDLETELDRFGAHALTGREQQVVQLLLRGHSTKSAASTLSISPETVKLHRKHIYRKLHVASHVDLFHLFVQALTNIAPNQAEPATP